MRLCDLIMLTRRFACPCVRKIYVTNYKERKRASVKSKHNLIETKRFFEWKFLFHVLASQYEVRYVFPL